MGSLFPVLVVLALLGNCLGDHHEVEVDLHVAPTVLYCQGACLEHDACHSIVNDTHCGDGMVCCMDMFIRPTEEYIEKTGEDAEVVTEEFHGEDAEVVTEEFHGEHAEVVTEDFHGDYVEVASEDIHDYVEVASEDFHGEREGYKYIPVAAENDDSDFTYAFSEESDDFELIDMEKRSDDIEGCPGTCVQAQVSDSCEYVISDESICPPESTCCLTERDVQKTSVHYNYELEEPTVIVKREVGMRSADSACPATCVHPSHAMFCEKILDQFSCPLNSKCCVKRMHEGPLPAPPVLKCTGQCLPLHVQGYCFPPNELKLGPTTCARGTTCCMGISAQHVVQPPSLNRMQFPGLPSRPIYESSQVMGHLAIDNTGSAYRVNTNGKIVPLPRLTPIDHMRGKYTKLTAFPRFDGEIAIYTDSTGVVFQQFYPRQSNPHFPRDTVPLIRHPIYQYAADAPDSQMHKEPDSAIEDAPEEELLEDIVIPDDDDEAPVSKNAPVVHEKSPRPPCPGSCMSYFLRFTCFRGFAIYDGFTCPGRSVCCARLKDIEDQEEYLKSLSPYFNTPPTVRGPSLPRCGIKGRRDTPRSFGGKESLAGEWCWQVAILNVQNQYICGGALIDNSWVLTAAHCVVGPLRENQAIFIRAGVTDLKSTDDNNQAQTIRVLSSFVHHNFNNMNLDNNIALLRLQKAVDLGPNICVVCLPTGGQMPDENAKCTVTGYGFVSEDGDMSLKIREAQVPVIDDMDCMANVTEALTNPFILPASSFCAGGQQDSCQGDAGGTLACDIGGFHEVIGLVSWGLGCGRNDVPSIYVKVPTFMGWINQIVSSSSYLMSLN